MYAQHDSIAPSSHAETALSFPCVIRTSVASPQFVAEDLTTPCTRTPIVPSQQRAIIRKVISMADSTSAAAPAPAPRPAASGPANPDPAATVPGAAAQDAIAQDAISPDAVAPAPVATPAVPQLHATKLSTLLE